MDESSLPQESVRLVISADPDALHRALQQALCGEPLFRNYTPIHDSSRSGRLFSVRPLAGETISLLMPPEQAASELVGYTSQARYDPEVSPKGGARKGWEVFALKINGSPAAVAWAAWTTG